MIQQLLNSFCVPEQLLHSFCAPELFFRNSVVHRWRRLYLNRVARKKKKTNEKRRRKEGNRWRSWPHPLCRYFGILQTPGLPEDSRAPPNTRNNPADCTSPKTVCLLSYTCGRSVRRWYPGSHVPPARVVADRKMCSVNQTSWLSLCCAGIARQELPFAFFFGARQFRNNA